MPSNHDEYLVLLPTEVNGIDYGPAIARAALESSP